MKILLLIVGSLVSLILLVIIIGLMLPKRHVATRAARYHTSPEALFVLITGPQNWRPDLLQSVESTDSAGRRFVQETSRNKEVITYELLDIQPPTSVKRKIVTQNLPYSGSWTFTLQPAGEDTLVRITEDGEVSNPVFRFVSRFILGHTATIDSYLRELGNATGQQVPLQD